MLELHYPTALKLGQKEYRRRTLRGEYPYLPALDDMLTDQAGLATVSLGSVQIPAEFVVGTKTAGRATSFAADFMPLLQSKTEFAIKWENLCQAHLKEGIRDSVVAYEYMNRYYIAEGNKRCSVLKYFGAATIPAIVTRILPEKTDAPENRLYYEYLDFYRVSRVNFISCSRLGSYKKLLQRLGKKPQEVWTEEETLSFQRFYYSFRKVYESMGGKKLTVTAADAMLVFLELCGYDRARELSAQELRQRLTRIWEEIVLQREDNPIDLVLSPDFGQKKLLGKLTDTLTGGDRLLVAFLHDKTPQDSSWTYLHELGREHVEQTLRGQVRTMAHYNTLEEDPEQVIRQAISAGSGLIFTTTPRLLKASLAVAVDHPEVRILNCSLNTSHYAIRTYYARMYEAKFVIGALAAALSEDHRIGYICDYPIYGMIAGINAFALGAQMVDPQAQVYLEWDIDSQSQAIRKLTDQGITIISGRDMTKPSSPNPHAFGLFRLSEEGTQQTLALPVWHWGVYYEQIIRSVLDKTFADSGEKKAKNYWWGMSAGVVEVICSEKLPGSVRKLARLISSAIRAGEFHPFDGILKSQTGLIHWSEDDIATPEEILTMDWLAENVVGQLPSYRQLSWEGKATVDVVGLEKIASQAAEETAASAREEGP